MGASKYIRKSFAETFNGELGKQRVRNWKRGGTVQRAEKPLNPGRARELGFKAKLGYFAVIVKTKRGRRSRDRPRIGRKPGKNRKRENPGKPWAWFAEQKARRRYTNATVLGSHLVGRDGSVQFFEVLMKTK
ncbi:MAG: hypothetical protein WC607_01885 [Candidatus Micrarchaeia archaeon]